MSTTQHVEFGSYFETVATGDNGDEVTTLLHRPASLFATARGALLAVVRGLRREGLARLWVPGYFCEDAWRLAVAETGTDVVAYSAPALKRPDVPWDDLRSTDAVVTFAQFGIRKVPTVPNGCAAWVIEDHSHDPFSDQARSSRAHYVLASLRKTLPLTDGAYVTCADDVPWVAPRHLPAACGVLHALTSSYRGLMEAKSQLHSVGRSASPIHGLYVAVEKAWDHVVDEAASAMTTGLLNGGLPIERWRSTRRRIYEEVAGVVPFDVPALPSRGQAPLCVPVSLTDRRAAARFRDALRARRVYAPSNWALPDRVRAGLTPSEVQAHESAEGRLVQLPCDLRYADASDELRDRILQAVREVRSS